jgi:low affinity Fe/Cu permease
VSDAPDPGIAPGYIIDPAIPDDAPLTVGEARTLQRAMGTLATTVGTFNDRLAGGERRWAVLTALGVAIVLVLGGVIWLGVGVRSIARCQAAQSEAVVNASTASRASRDAADEQQIRQLDQFRGQIQQQIALLNASLNPEATIQDRIAATKGYLDKLQQSDQTALQSQQTIRAAEKARADNPLPTGSCT